MPEKKKVIFRRVRGRIIPIHVKEGTFDLASGVAVGAGSGALSSAMIRADRYIMPPLARMATSARFRKAASVFGRKKSIVQRILGMTATVKNTQKAMRYGFRASTKAKKLAPAVFLGGALTGTVLAAQGASKIAGKHRDSTPAKVGSVAAAGTAIGAANYSFLRAGGQSHRRSVVAGVQMVPPAIRRIMKLRF